MRVYFAGGGRAADNAYLIERGAYRLQSFLNEPKACTSRWGDGALMVDSGAHSWNAFTMATIKRPNAKLPPADQFLDTFTRWASSEAPPPRSVLVEFDVYGLLPIALVDESARVIRASRPDLEFVRVYHSALDGGTGDALRRWIDDGITYTGVSGFEEPEATVDMVFNLTRDKIKVHGFAMTRTDRCERWPFASIDSTSWLSPMQYGCVPRRSGFGLSGKTTTTHVEAWLVKEDKVTLTIDRWLIEARRLTQFWRARGVVWDGPVRPGYEV